MRRQHPGGVRQPLRDREILRPTRLRTRRRGPPEPARTRKVITIAQQRRSVQLASLAVCERRLTRANGARSAGRHQRKQLPPLRRRDEMIWYGGQGHSIIWRPFGHLPTRHRHWSGVAGWSVRDDRHASWVRPSEGLLPRISPEPGPVTRYPVTRYTCSETNFRVSTKRGQDGRSETVVIQPVLLQRNVIPLSGS
jgi:hypothetical protein